MNRENVLGRLGWIDGYLSALYDYAIWRDGEMYLGCGIDKYADIAKPLKDERKDILDVLTGITKESEVKK